MEVTYICNSAFLIKTSMGRKFLTDPCFAHKPDVSILDNINIITVSHNHINVAKDYGEYGSPKVLTSGETYEDADIRISSIKSFHDGSNGFKRGSNYIYIYEFDGLRLCHAGHLGSMPSKDVLSTLSFIDILFIPIGGNFTLDAKEASKLCDALKPKIIIPMCYKFLNFPYGMDGVSKFLYSMKHSEISSAQSLIINSMPFSEEKVFVLPPLISI